MRLRDAVAFGSTRAAVRSAYAQVSAVQDERYPDAFMGAAILFVELTKNLGMDISEVINWAERYTQDDDKEGFLQLEVAALRNYIRREFATKYSDLRPVDLEQRSSVRALTNEEKNAL